MVIEEIACGDAHSACITEDGDLYVWGCSDNYKLGFPQKVCVDKEIPAHVYYFVNTPIKHIYLGLNNSFAISRSNEVYAWGSSSFGKIGVPGSATWKLTIPYKLYLPGTNMVY